MIIEEPEICLHKRSQEHIVDIQHVKADPEKFTLLAFNKVEGHVNIEPIDLGNMKVFDGENHLKRLWGLARFYCFWSKR